MKVRVFYKDEKIICIEHDPRYYEKGEYSNTFYPYTFLKDSNDPSQGYGEIPDCVVVDSDIKWNDKSWEYLSVTDGKIIFDKKKYNADQSAQQLSQKRKEDTDKAMEWKKTQLSTVDWTQTPLSSLERKIIIGVSSFSDDEIDEMITEYTNAVG